MSGVASETGSISPTIVAKIVIDNIMVTPGRNPASINQKERRDVTPYQFMVTRAVLNRQIRTVEDFYRVSNFPAIVTIAVASLRFPETCVRVGCCAIR